MSRFKALMTVVLGAILLGLGLYSLRGAFASRGWATTDGLVTHSDTTTGQRGVPRADIRYSYSVDGRSFTGTRVAEVFFSDDEALVERYPVGTRVSVKYDPVDPASSLLQRPGLFRGLLAAGAGLALILYSWQSVRA